MYSMYTPDMAKECGKDVMEKQVKECVEGLLAVRLLLVKGNLTDLPQDEVLLLLHEAADLLLMRM